MRGQPRHDRNLVNGLSPDERLTMIEATLDGDKYHEGLVRRVELLEHEQRRRELGWFGRALLKVRFARRHL